MIAWSRFGGPMAAFETTMTIPTLPLPALMTRLSKAGFTVFDTGERLTTDDGLEAEATVRLVDVASIEIDETVPLGVTP